ncbi:MAG: UDP-2,3-diacylglucosamine diphosphatase [Colwellia sp.]
MTENQKQKQTVTYFIADLHLTQSRPDITSCFLRFLKNDAIQAEKLYILGDLFEFWIGDDDDSSFVRTISSALHTLSSSGTQIYFIHGNRDFLVGKGFAKRSGMQLLPEIDLIDLYGRDVVIMHGDTLCTRDVDYQKFRKKSRTWWWQLFMTNLPLFLRKKIAQNYRNKSASATMLKPQEIMDVTPSEVVDCLTSYHCQLLIHGHTHKPFIHDLVANGEKAQRIVLGDWYDQGAWLKVTPEKIELLNQQFTK